MVIKRLLLFLPLLLNISLVYRCKHSPTEILDEEPLHEQIAGVYAGGFSCGTYNGTYGSNEYSGSVELVAIGADTLGIAISDGCVFASEAFKYDSLASVGFDYTMWRGFGQYHELRHFAANDSVTIATPEHYSIGWLGRSFNGKKN